MNPIRCLIIFAILFMYQVANAQTYQISGKVTNEEQSPVSFVSVHLLNTNFYTQTDKLGNFVFLQVPAGNYGILLEAEEYASLMKQVEIAGSNAEIMVQMNRSVQQLDEVVVTAEKREDKLQQVPVSISALNARSIDNYRIWNSQQLTAIVPSLYSDNPGDSRNITSVRGIVTTSYDPAVATYIDGVNQFSLDSYISTISDAERIEVLRGPQGTLYGRNAMGGVINILSKAPTNNTSLFGEASLGNYALQRYNAGFRTPLLKNKLFAGANILYTSRNGYYDNETTKSSFDKQHLFYGNYFLIYKPAQRWSITLNTKHQANRNNGAFPLVNGKQEAFEHAYKLSQDAVSTMIDNSLNSSLSVVHSGKSLNVSAISSYQKNYRYYDKPLDGDFSPADIVTIKNNYGKPNNEVQVFTQELRVSSPGANKKWQYTAGAYFFYQTNPAKQATYFGKDAGLYGVDDTDFEIINQSGSKGTGTALFGQLSYAVTQHLRLTAGMRYDNEHRSLSVESSYKKGDFDMNLLPDTSASANFHAVSPKFTIQYLISGSSNVYATYTRGFRTGGLSPLSSDPSQPPLYAYLPEKSDNYEAGTKHTFRDGKLSVNLSIYTSYIRNAQVPTLVLPEAITLIKNTGRLRTSGVEAEITALPAKGLMLGYSGSVISTRYQSLTLSQNGTAVNLAGKHQVYTPSATSMLFAQYNLPLAKELSAFVRGEWQYRGNMYFDFANSIEQPRYHLFHTRAGIDTKKVGLYIWCRNVFAKKYIAYAYDFGAVHLGDPQTFGLTLRAHINQ